MGAILAHLLLLVALAPAALVAVVDAYTGGAGQCLVGKSSVASLHLDASGGRAIRTGALARGGFAAVLGGVDLGSPAKGERKIKAGAAHSLVIRGSGAGDDASFRGVLVAATPDMSAAVFTFAEAGSDATLQGTNNCVPPTVGVTHTSAERKARSTVVLQSFNETVFKLDANVVVANNGTWSIYYYQQFRVRAVAGCRSPGQSCATSAGCCLGRACVGPRTNKRCRQCRTRAAACRRTDECCNGLACRLISGKRTCRP
jgi:hypothetical protein